MATDRFDIAYQQTDDIIAKIEKRIAKEYKQAHKEVTQKMKNYLEAYERKNEKWLEWVNNGTKTKDDYRKWLHGQIMMGKRWAEMKDTLAQDYTNTAKIAQSIAKGYRPEVYALNHNYATFDIEKQSQLDTSYTLYSRESVERMYRDNPKLYHDPGRKTALDIKEGRVKQWNKQRVQSVITQGILQGESIPQLAKRLEKVTQGGYSAAVRNARTMMTGVQNAGRIDAQNRAKGMGIPVKKQWLATLDGRTRDWHVDLDGEIVETDEPFVNSIGEIDYPGDPGADPANVYNCRCCLLSAIKGFEIDVSDTDLRNTTHMEEETYEEWKNRHKEERDQETAHVIAEGKDITGSWERREGQFAFEIEDVMNAQGFDGLPRFVSQADFYESVKAANGGKGLIAHRAYSAESKEILDAYRDQLYNGKWYVDCSSGGAFYGQGMYGTVGLDGTITQEMIDADKFYSTRFGNDKQVRIEEFTLMKNAKMVEYHELNNEFLKDTLSGKASGIEDVGSYAVAKGYDAIIIINEGVFDSNEVVVLNRTKMIINGK